jgi:hypothetical protein
MRQGGKNRSRGRNGRNGHKPHIPMRIQTFDSAGPDVRIRGNAWQVHERYLNMAREAFQAGDRVAAENFFQYADHYYRMVNGEGRPQQGPNGQPPHQQGQPIPQQGQHPQGPNQQPPIQGQHPQMGQPQMQQGQPLPQGQIHQGQPMGYPPHPQTGGQDQREAEQAEPLDRGRLPHPGE